MNLGVSSKIQENLIYLPASLIEDKKSLLAGYLAMKRGCRIIPVAYKKFNIGLLKKFDYNLKLNVVKNIKEIEKIAEKNSAKALITGQTLNDFNEIKTRLIILRPLIGLKCERSEQVNLKEYLIKIKPMARNRTHNYLWNLVVRNNKK